MEDETIEQAARTLDGPQTVHGLLDATCRALVEALGANACAISRVVGDLLIGLVEHARGEGERPLALGHEHLISDFPLTLEVVTTGEPRAVSLLESSPEPTEATLLQKLGYDSLLMLCLSEHGDGWGLVEIYANGRAFDDGQTQVATEITMRAGRRLELLNQHG